VGWREKERKTAGRTDTDGETEAETELEGDRDRIGERVTAL
jgi:hypothetical protein